MTALEFDQEGVVTDVPEAPYPAVRAGSVHLAFLLITLAALLLPLALAKGGHNGVTLVGVLVIIIAIGITVATATPKDTQ